MRRLSLTGATMGATVYWQATAVTLVGLVVGVPIGVALGR